MAVHQGRQTTISGIDTLLAGKLQIESDDDCQFYKIRISAVFSYICIFATTSRAFMNMHQYYKYTKR